MKRDMIIALLLSAALLTGCASDANIESSAATSGQTSAVESVDATSQVEQTTTAASEEIDANSSTQASEEAVPAETTTATQPETTTTEVTTVTTTAENTTSAVSDTTASPEEVEIVETKYIALTFDDGPNTTTTAEVLDKLEKYDIVASFFLIGNNINDESAKVVKRAYDMGCEIHNHSKSHPDMTKMTDAEIAEEFRYTDDKIFEITGERSGFFRPPYIAVNEAMLIQIDVPFIAGIGCNDWDDRVTAERRAMSILRQAKDGDIILLHDAQGNSQTVEALDTIIPELQKNGYKFVTVTELFELKGIEISGLDTKVYTNVLQKNMYN